MGRWEPGASGRLREAAMELYVEHGFAQTTVADIAERAGVTPRTFFRYFADKREVLFGGSTMLLDAIIEALEATPTSATPMSAVADALAAGAALISTDHGYSRRRQSVIVANQELQERELVKMATIAAALADGLRRRGVLDPDATLAAEAGTTVFRVAFEQWANGPDDRELAQVMKESQVRLTSLTGDARA